MKPDFVPSRASCVVLLIAGLCLACGPPPPLEERSIVLIVIDTLRADALDFADAGADTPFLDELASSSLVFDEVRSASTWTAPATASIFTSTLPDRHGVTLGVMVRETLARLGTEIRMNRIPEDLETIPEFMSLRGYATYGISTNPNVAEPMGFAEGFDRFDAVVYDGAVGRAAEVVDKALEWGAEMRGQERFFLYLHFMDPHEPYVRNLEFMADGEPPVADPMEDRAAYDSEIAYLDREIGRLFRSLGLDDAVVVVTADHGQAFGEHGTVGHPFQLYGELLRVPLLIHLPTPDAPSGRIATPVSTLDILPTLRAIAGAPPSAQDAGISLLDPAALASGAPRAFLGMRTSHRPDGSIEMRAVVQAGYKLIETEPGGATELYDLSSDPGEQRDLSRTRAGRVAALENVLVRRIASLGDRGPAPTETRTATPEEVEALKRLGYVE